MVIKPIYYGPKGNPLNLRPINMGFAHRKEVIAMLDLSLREKAEVLSAIDLAIQKEMNMMHRYEDVMPWKAERHEKSLQELKSAREKICQSMK